MNPTRVIATFAIVVAGLVQSLAANDKPRPNRVLEEGFRGVFTVKRDGTDFKFLFAAPGMITTGDPAWSHNGKMIACNGLPGIDAVVQSKIFIYHLDGPLKGKSRELAEGNTPSWSPDDKQIAYMINGGNPSGVKGGMWIMNADGSKRRWLGDGFYPRWSPDGKLLCCHAWFPDGTPSLFSINVVTGAVRPILRAKGWSLRNYGGTWSPDSQRIVFVGSFEGKDRLATIGVEGRDDSIRILYTNTDPRQELFGPPAWSPDGRQIVFIIQPRGPSPRQWWDSMLYTIDSDGRSAPSLLEGEKIGNINRGMNWSPDSALVIFSSER
jgi:hypothetical protein